MSSMRTCLLAALVLVALTTLPGAQAPEHPRTAWGDPSLEGVWLSVNRDGVPFQRPDDTSDDSILHELVESGVIERVVRRDRFPLSALQAEPVREERRNTLAAWRLTGEWRGSLIVEPPDGRLPPLTPEGAARAAAAWRTTESGGPWAGPADLGPVERCLSRGPIGSMVPALDYHGIEIVQAPGVVVLRHETMHDTRVIWLDGRPAPGPAIRGYMGHSRGRWDGEILVVETTGFNGRTGARAHGNELPTSPALTLLEHFTRMDDGTLLYDVTVTDPGTWTEPWRMVFPLWRHDGYELAEYACHEGNRAIRNILSVHRAREAAR
jgi:hypothetical protein